MGYLDNLAQGLRAAGGVLNPEVQRETFAQDAATDARNQQFGQQLALQRQQFELQQSTPAAKLAQAQLENETGFRRAVGEAGGDMTKIATAAMTYGKPEVAMNIYNQAQSRQDKLIATRETLAQKAEEFKMRMEDRAATREQQAQYQQGLLALRQQSLALQQQIAQGNQQLKSMQIEMMGDKKQKAEERGRMQTTQKLSAAFEKAGLSTMNTVLSAAESAVSDDKILAYVNGPKSSVPDFAASNEVTGARQAITKLFNVTLKDRSGAAVTNQELERLKDEFGKGVFKKPEQLREAVQKARGIVEDHYRGIAAGFGKTALDDFNRNMEEIGGTPVLTGRKPIASSSNPPAGFKLD